MRYSGVSVAWVGSIKILKDAKYCFGQGLKRNIKAQQNIFTKAIESDTEVNRDI